MNEQLLIRAHGMTDDDFDERLRDELPVLVDLDAHGRQREARRALRAAHPCPCHDPQPELGVRARHPAGRVAALVTSAPAARREGA